MLIKLFYCYLCFYFLIGIRTPPCIAIPPNRPMFATGILCKAFDLRRVRKQTFFPGLTQNLLRRDGDSNPGNPFGVYTLSRRASSTTRASLLGLFHNRLQRYCFFTTYARVFCFFLQILIILCEKVALRCVLLSKLCPQRYNYTRLPIVLRHGS